MSDKPRKFIILTASIGTGHSQAARAIAESIQKSHPSDSVSVLDFVSNNPLSIDHIIKDSYLKMIDVFPAMYDHLYSDSQSSRFGVLSQYMLSITFKRRMRSLAETLKPDAFIFTHPFPAGAADLLKADGRISMPLLGVITDFDIHQLWVDPHLDAFCVATPDLKDLMETYDIPGDMIHVTGIPVRHSFYEQAAQKKPFEKGTVLVMGGGLAGCECAISLGMEGKEVQLVEMRDALAPDANVRHRPLLLKEIEKQVKAVHTGYRAEEITPEGVWCTDANGERHLVEGTTVICALGQRARTDVVEQLRNTAPFVRVIGDARRVSTITNAVYQGYHAALDI
jgi:hypothetical protein